MFCMMFQRFTAQKSEVKKTTETFFEAFRAQGIYVGQFYLNKHISS